MKGLLIKDSYVIVKQMRVYLILMLVMILFSNELVKGFMIIYATILPITAVAYDEQAKWDSLAAMMPYKSRDIVLSKYILGISASFIAGAAAVIGNIVRTVLKLGDSFFLLRANWEAGITCIAAILLLSVLLPILFKFGTEKGRFIYMLVAMGFAMASVWLVQMTSHLPFWWWGTSKMIIYPVCAIIVLFILAVSIKSSVRLYESKKQ